MGEKTSYKNVLLPILNNIVKMWNTNNDKFWVGDKLFCLALNIYLKFVIGFAMAGSSILNECSWVVKENEWSPSKLWKNP